LSDRDRAALGNHGRCSRDIARTSAQDSALDQAHQKFLMDMMDTQARYPHAHSDNNNNRRSSQPIYNWAKSNPHGVTMKLNFYY
jgi:hypothetical protein